MDLFDKILSEAAARRDYAQNLKPATRRFNARKGGGVFFIISPSCNPGGAWRVTRFDEIGACGHMETLTHAAALLDAHASGADIFNVIEEITMD